MIADSVRKPTYSDGFRADSMITHLGRLRVHAFRDTSHVDFERVWMNSGVPRNAARGGVGQD
jgi:hypothetical protein